MEGREGVAYARPLGDHRSHDCRHDVLLLWRGAWLRLSLASGLEKDLAPKVEERVDRGDRDRDFIDAEDTGIGNKLEWLLMGQKRVGSGGSVSARVWTAGRRARAQADRPMGVRAHRR